MTGLRPFWRYYGGKWRAAPQYPPPRHDLIIEPFAGAAGYACRYPDRDVLLIDASPIIAGIWSWLVSVSADDVRALPDIPEGGTVDDMDAPQPARWLAGYWCNNGVAEPRKSPSRWAASGTGWDGWNAPSRERIASQVDRIRHWRIVCGDYAEAPDVAATWYIDPPYSTPAGRHYRHQPASFDALGAWCRTRRGQVIVCEQEGATWLPFRPHGRIKATAGKGRAGSSPEVVWIGGEP